MQGRFLHSRPSSGGPQTAMKLVDFIREDMIVPELRSREKFDVIRELAGHLSRAVEGVAGEDLVRVLSEREKLASTAIGDGIAIPHGKLDAVGTLVACVGRSASGVSFDSMDGKPTHLFFVLVAPENSTGIHLKALARISRLFKDHTFRSRLMKARGPAEMYSVISTEDGKY